jgi:uncharacterized delta-60 repeat protein
MVRFHLESLEDRFLPALMAPLDPSFASGGTLLGPFGTGNDQVLVTHEALQTDGKIVLVGKLKTPDTDVGVVRLTANGQLDSTFGTGGIARISGLVSGGLPQAVPGVAIDSQGRIVVSGEIIGSGPTGTFLTAVRLTPSGQLDSMFGTAGRAGLLVGQQLGGLSLAGVPVAIASGDRVVLSAGGTDPTTHNATSYLGRLTAAGIPDSTFGTSGVATISYGVGSSSNPNTPADNLFVLPDGRLVLVGAATAAGGHVTVVTRLTSSGALDPTYVGGQGFTFLSSFAGSPAAAIQSDGSVVLAGTLTNSSFSGVARLTPVGVLDTSFGAQRIRQLPLPKLNGLVTAADQSNASTVSRVALQADGKIVVLLQTQSVGLGSVVFDRAEYVLRLQTDGTNDSTFSATGVQMISVGVATDLVIQPDGRYVVVGNGSSSPANDTMAGGPTYAVLRLQGGAAPAVFHAITPISFDPTTAIWYVRQSNPDGTSQVVSFPFGLPGWKPVVGDWNGSGAKGIGVFDPSTGTWYLRPAFSTTVIQFVYGAPGWIPVAGDWNADGTDTIGVVDPSTMTWYLRNSNSAGAPSYNPFQYGAVGWVPVAGDWIGQGHAGIGVFDPSTATWYLRNETNGGTADAGTFQYGGAGWQPVVGDWSLTFTATVGVVDPTGHWYLRKSNGSGAPDAGSFSYGLGNWTPLSGAY